MTRVVEAEGVCVNLGAQCVLHDVALRVEAGEWIGILGPNGGGKTTLLRALLGLHRPDHGTIRVLGGDPTSPKVRRRIGYVAQNATETDPFFPATAEEVVLSGRVGRRGLLHRTVRADRAAAQEAMEEAGVWDLRHQRMARLSGGQRQRVHLARALAQEPDVLFLDEALSAVDVEGRRAFLERLDNLHKGHRMGVVMVTHDPHALLGHAQRVYHIERTVRFHGTPEEHEALHGHRPPRALHPSAPSDPHPGAMA